MELVNQSQIVIARIRWSKIYANWYYLYKEENIGSILETLRLVEENNISPTILAFLVKNAAEQTIKRLYKKESHIINHAEELVRFAIAVFNRQNDVDKENFVNIAGKAVAR